MNIEETLASIILHANYDDLPSEIIEITENQILDGLGVTLAGTQADGIKELVEVLTEWGGAPQSTIIGYDSKVPAPYAAQANASMMHALDFDDSSDVAAMHPGVPVFATSLALAEYIGKLSGKEFITCLAYGTNLIHRLGRATRPNGELVSIGWHTTTMYGTLGSAAIAGRILGLNLDQMQNALGIAYHQCAGNLQSVYDGALTKRLGPGFASRNGITSAILAKKGLTGATHWLTGKAGLINLYHNGDFDTDILMKDFSERFDALDLTFKPYPCCRITHAFIDAALKLASEHTITKDTIKEITVFAGDGAYHLCIPLEVRCNPKNSVTSQFSVPWAIATAIVKRKGTISDFDDEAINNQETISVANKVKVQLDPTLVGHGIQPGRVTIETSDGNSYTVQVDCPLGNRENPMSLEQFENKFRDCASHYLKPLSEENIQNLIGITRNIKNLDNVTELIRAL